jgi:DNA-binding NarL/FixJ family response regulator
MNKEINKVDLIAQLATREREVFDCIVIGMRTKEIGDKFNIKANTVSTIKKVILRKLNVTSNIELFKIAQECQLV